MIFNGPFCNRDKIQFCNKTIARMLADNLSFCHYPLSWMTCFDIETILQELDFVSVTIWVSLYNHCNWQFQNIKYFTSFPQIKNSASKYDILYVTYFLYFETKKTIFDTQIDSLLLLLECWDGHPWAVDYMQIKISFKLNCISSSTLYPTKQPSLTLIIFLINLFGVI